MEFGFCKCIHWRGWKLKMQPQRLCVCMYFSEISESLLRSTPTVSEEAIIHRRRHYIYFLRGKCKWTYGVRGFCANIKRTDRGGVELYTGVTGGVFKTRWYQHCVDIRKYDPIDGSYGKGRLHRICPTTSRGVSWPSSNLQSTESVEWNSKIVSFYSFFHEKSVSSILPA